MLLQLAVKSRNSHGIVPLKLTNSYVHHSEDQAEILNKQSNLFLLRNIYLTFLTTVGKSLLIIAISDLPNLLVSYKTNK